MRVRQYQGIEGVQIIPIQIEKTAIKRALNYILYYFSWIIPLRVRLRHHH